MATSVAMRRTVRPMLAWAASAAGTRRAAGTATRASEGMQSEIAWKPSARNEPPAGNLPNVVDAATAVRVVKSNDRVFLHSAASNPRHLVESLVARARAGEALNNVELCHLHLEGTCAYTDPALASNFHGVNFFVGGNQRQAVAEGRSDFMPIFLSEVALLFRRGLMPLDVAFLSVSPPDRHGYCSLGPSVDISLDAMTASKVVIGQVNKFMPRTHGDGIVHVSRFNYLVQHDEPLPEASGREHTAETDAIGRHVAALVEDGSTLQMGIGAIPDAVLSMLTDRKDLGIHTEMFSEGVIELVKKGVISNRHKTIMPYHIVASFLTGSRTLFDFVDDNPLVHLAPSHYVNDPSIIKRNPKVVAINSAVEVDLTGQICADSIGSRIFSGIGGQMDFIRGAALSEGGKPIIALPSRTNKGTSRIVPFLQEGAGVVTTRAHAHWIVTEYGAVNLYGKALRERARLLISIAHPDDRAKLFDAALKRYGPTFKTVH